MKLIKATALITAFAASLFMSSSATACSETTPCEIAGGQYFIGKPDNADDGPLPAIIFIHGFGGSGQGVFKNTGMTNSILDRGYALIAPSSMPFSDRPGGTWSFHPDIPKQRDDIDFITRVRDDIIENHQIDPEKILLAGFSIGGSMVSYLACAAPNSFKAYAPVSGSFWRPHPKGCKGHVKLLHTHGWSDGTVPLEGRVLRGGDITMVGALAQGDVFFAMEIWREANDCLHLKADSFDTEGPFWRRKWDRCLRGSALELALFPGGHVIPREWPDMAIEWFEGF